MRKIISIVLTLGVILGLTAFAAPVAAAPCTCPATMSSFDILTPPFCAGATQNYLLGSVTPITVPITLLPGADSFSVDFPSDTDLSAVVAAGVTVTGIAPFAFPAANPAAVTVSGQHLEFVIPASWLGTSPVVPAGQTITIQVNSVTNPTVADTYCLYIDYVESCGTAGCPAVQFACQTYAVVPAVKTVDFHFDFSADYAGLHEDYIPPFKACGDPVYGTPALPGFVTTFDLILRDENGGCADPCTTPSKFWFEVTACPPGETIWFDDGVNPAYSLTDADIGTEYSLLATHWGIWPAAPVDVTWTMQIHFSSPGDYELCFYLQCPSVPCGAGPTIVADECLPATAHQYFDAWKVPLEEKWNLVSLPLFPYDTSIASVLGTIDRIDQLKSVWYFDQCEDPDAYEGVWHSEVYDPVGGTFTPGTMEIQAGKAYWIRTLHVGETGYVAGANGFWVFGTSSIMPGENGMDMGYFDVCEGWNMVGFKAPWLAGVPTTQLDNTFVPGGYLWNFNVGPFDTKYGMIYDWNPAPLPGFWTTWIPGTLLMQPGEGYWIPFDGDDVISPPA